MPTSHCLNQSAHEDIFLSHFCGKRVLLLQGPIGPFFKNLSVDLTNAGATVFKINFNGGDCFFYPNAINYKGRLSGIGDFVRDTVNTLNIGTFAEVVLVAKCVGEN